MGMDGRRLELYIGCEVKGEVGRRVVRRNIKSCGQRVNETTGGAGTGVGWRARARSHCNRPSTDYVMTWAQPAPKVASERLLFTTKASRRGWARVIQALWSDKGLLAYLL